MNLAQEFRRHATECRRMARETRDPASKRTWMRLADRWIVCAEMAERASAAARRSREAASEIENRRAPLPRKHAA